MINGKAHCFLDVLYSGQNIVYIFHGIKYWFQGYTTSSGFHMEILQYQPISEEIIWECDAPTASDCKKAFLSAAIFDGKTFWDAEKEIEWTDD